MKEVLEQLLEQSKEQTRLLKKVARDAQEICANVGRLVQRGVKDPVPVGRKGSGKRVGVGDLGL